MFGSKVRHQQRRPRTSPLTPISSFDTSTYNDPTTTISPAASTLSDISERSLSYHTGLSHRLSSSDSSINVMDQPNHIVLQQQLSPSTLDTTKVTPTHATITPSLQSPHASYIHNISLHECASDGYNNSHPQWSVKCVQRGDQWLRVLRPERLRKRFIPGTYAKLARQLEQLNDHPIRKDLSRTYPNHPLFIGAQLDDIDMLIDTNDTGAGRPMLYNLLRAYAAYDIDVGYSQGLAFIAAFLVIHIPNDELAFFSLVILMLNQQFNIRWLYESDCMNLPLMFNAFERMMSLHTPRAYKHMQEQSVQPSMFATQWFLTVFCYRVSYNFTATLWDSFILESQQTTYDGRQKRVMTAQSGWLIVRLLQTATAVIKYFENHLCTLQFEKLVPFLSNPPQLDTQLVRLSLTLAVPPSVQQLLGSALHINNNSSPHSKIRNRLQQQTLNRRRSNRKSLGRSALTPNTG